MLFSSYFCVKETWLALVSVFPNRQVFPDCLCRHQLIHPSIQSLSHHILVQCLKWARTLTTEAALVSTFTNMGVCGPGTGHLETDTQVCTCEQAYMFGWSNKKGQPLRRDLDIPSNRLEGLGMIMSPLSDSKLLKRD